MSDPTSHLPPQDVDNEIAALAAMMCDGRAARNLSRSLTTEDFYLDTHRLLFDAMATMTGAGKPVDHLTTMAELDRRGDLARVGGKLGVLTIMEKLNTVAGHKAYGEAVRNTAVRRALVDAGHKLARDGYETVDPDALLELAERALFTARTRLAPGGTGQPMTMHQLLQHRDYLQGPDTDVLTWPLPILNTMGLRRRGQLTITGGYSADGKSWWGLQCAEHSARQGARTLVVSIEMPKDEVMDRLVAQGGIPFGEVRDGIASHDRICERANDLCELPITVADASNKLDTAGRIRMELTRARVDGHPYRDVLIDHLHQMSHLEPRNDFRLAIGETVKQLKNMCVEFACSMQLLAQLRRASSDNKYPVPSMSDFRESSAIENNADVALMVWRERDGTTLQQNGYIVTAKVRSGKNLGAVEVRLDPDTLTFQDRNRVPGAYAPQSLGAIAS